MKRKKEGIYPSLVLALGLLAGCSTAPPDVHFTQAALTASECNFFDVNGKVRICHATGSQKKPYTILQLSDNGCINGHAGHANDYVATSTDPDCRGGGCFPLGAPVDQKIPCCPGLVARNGVCTDLCAGVHCAANDQCHVAGTCDPNSGLCANPNQTDGAACSDGDACTQVDTCQAGTCVGANPVVCAALDQCHSAGTCDPAIGTCSNPAASDGTPCNDGDPCTTSDTCQGGSCAGSGGGGGAACNNSCVDLTSDQANCGACGVTCGPGQSCTAGVCVAVATGCSDGTREGFVNVAAYPNIAACSGGWSIPGVRTPTTVSAACGRVAGNSSNNPTGAGCNVTDLCATGWHVCLNAAEVSANTGGNGCNDAKVNGSFFIQREASAGYYACVDSNDLTAFQNDLWGCGGTMPLMSGLIDFKPCGVLNVNSGDGCGNLPAPWNCNVGGLSSLVEAARVTKAGPDNGGVLCCKD